MQSLLRPPVKNFENRSTLIAEVTGKNRVPVLFSTYVVIFRAAFTDNDWYAARLITADTLAGSKGQKGGWAPTQRTSVSMRNLLLLLLLITADPCLLMCGSVSYKCWARPHPGPYSYLRHFLWVSLQTSVNFNAFCCMFISTCDSSCRKWCRKYPRPEKKHLRTRGP